MLIENTPTLETQRLILRKFSVSDITDMQALYGDNEVNKFLPWFPMKTKNEVYEYLNKAIFPCYQMDIAYNYAVTMKTNGRVIGYVHINDIGDSNDLGYALNKEFWHQGMAFEACSAVVERFFKAGFQFITATHDINNPSSGAVMKKLGMTYRYSYKEQWQPKNIPVVFRMYQLDFDGIERTYAGYKNKYPFFVEQIL